jgi:hypothetical protein
MFNEVKYIVYKNVKKQGPHYGALQTTLLRLLEDWKSALDKNCYVAAILMDLSKAFDCLPHDILLSKLAAYGLSSQSVKLLENYLTGRKLAEY